MSKQHVKGHKVETPAPQPPVSSGAEAVPADDPRRAPPPETRNAASDNERLLAQEKERQENAAKDTAEQTKREG